MRAFALAAGTAAVLALSSGAALAAGIGAGSTSLGAGGAPVGSCGTFALTASPYVVDPASGTVTAVQVSVPTSCNGATVSVALRTGTDPTTSAFAGSGTATVGATTCPSGVCTVTITMPPGLDAVQAVHVVVSGP